MRQRLNRFDLFAIAWTAVAAWFSWRGATVGEVGIQLILAAISTLTAEVVRLRSDR